MELHGVPFVGTHVLSADQTGTTPGLFPLAVFHVFFGAFRAEPNAIAGVAAAIEELCQLSNVVDHVFAFAL